MPPHCDSLDGPVVKAALRALETEDVDVVLPFVHEEGEAEVHQAFELAVKARTQGVEAREVADRYFFETAVRIHRHGEGAPFTGLKPAGLDVGPVIPLAEAAIATGDVTALADFLSSAVRDETIERFNAMLIARQTADKDVGAARTYIEAMLGLQVWSHKLYMASRAAVHEGTHEHQ